MVSDTPLVNANMVKASRRRIDVKFANAAFITVISGNAIGWVAYTIPILQGMALVVAIVSGIYAIRVYRRKLKEDE